MTTAAEIQAQAAAWLVKRDGRSVSDAAQAEFESWLASDPRARAAYVRLDSAWKQADTLKRLRPLDGDVDPDLLAHPPFAPVPIDEYPASEETRAAPAEVVSDAMPSRPRWRGWLVGLAVAATFAVLGVGALLWYTHHQADWHTYSTDFGGLSKIVLDDGSVVNLEYEQSDSRAIHAGASPHRSRARRGAVQGCSRSGSPLRGGGERRDGSCGRHRVLGPGGEPHEAHNGPKDVEVLVKEGRVAIDAAGNEKRREPVASFAAKSATLSAGETAVINGVQPVEIQQIDEADVERKLSWTEGRLWFERQTLKDVVAEFNRYNRRKMVIADPTIANLRIGGGFEATDPESFMIALERTLGVRALPARANDGSSDEVVRLVRMQKNTQ